VNAVIEAIEHDNSVVDADQAPDADVRVCVDYDQRADVSVHDATAWANDQRCPVTLYLYDEGAGTEREEHFKAQAVRFPDDEDDERTSH